MKQLNLATLVLFSMMATLSIAGYMHPIETSGEVAEAVRNTPKASTANYKIVPSHRGGRHIGSIAPSPKIPLPSKEAVAKGHEKINIDALPTTDNIGVPEIKLPMSHRNAFELPRAPELRGRNRVEILHFAKLARSMREPDHSYGTLPRARSLEQKYSNAFHLIRHHTIRTPIELALAKHAKIQYPPAPVSYELMVKRLDALFNGFYYNYPPAIMALWELSELKESAEYRPKDALFAGMFSGARGWETTAEYLFEKSVKYKVENLQRHREILWHELDSIKNQNFVDKIVAQVNVKGFLEKLPKGNKANYSLARKFLRTSPADLVLATEKITDSALREHLNLLAALKSKGENPEDLDLIKMLATDAHENVKQEARLALARTLLLQGKNQEALDAYRSVQKNGQNRLEVMSEQIYAEYKNGLFQESIGKSIGLESRYFEYAFSPDIPLVDALSRKAICDFGGAEQGLRRLSEWYTPELSAMESLLGKKINPSEYYKTLISYHSLESPMRFQRYLLHLPAVVENQKSLNQGEKELYNLSQLGAEKYTAPKPAGWEKFTGAVESHWKKYAEEMKVESSSIAQREMNYLVARTRQTLEQAKLVELDVSTYAAKNFNLQNALNFPARKPASVKIEKGKFEWPFEQEIWEDELDYMKVKNPGKCASLADRK